MTQITPEAPSSFPTARHTLRTLSDIALVALAGTSIARAAAITSTLRQIAEIAGDLPLGLADCGRAYRILGEPPSATIDDAATAARRLTCKELALIAGWSLQDPSLEVERQRVSRMVRVLQEVAQQLTSSEDPRQATIGRTALRESVELTLYLDALT